MTSRLDGLKVITLSRRIPTADGTFAGVVVGTVQLSFFRHAFDRLDLGPHRSITLVQDDGSIVLRDPDLAPGSILPDAAKETYRKAARKPAGFGIALGPDGIYRLYSYARIDNFPIFVVVGFAVRDVLAPWLQKVAVIVALALLFFAATIILARKLERELKRRQEAEASLLAFNQKLEATTRLEVAAREEAQGRLVASQRMEALGQLAGGIAHDLTTSSRRSRVPTGCSFGKHQKDRARKGLPA